MNFRLVGIALLSTVVFAQGPGHPRMHHMSGPAKTTEVQSYLNLTDAQIAALKQLSDSERAALKPIFQQMEQEHASNADAAAVSKLEQQIAPIRSSFQQQAQAVLTPDQKTKLAALESALALMPAIHQAMGLNLLSPPKGMEGMRHGPFGGPR